MSIKKYTNENFELMLKGVPTFKQCPYCDGKGEYTIFKAIDEHESAETTEVCSGCEGEGIIEVDLRECPCCNSIVDRNDMYFVKDRYGNPYKLVCDDCIEKTEKEIGSWVFDESYCGESLEEDY